MTPSPHGEEPDTVRDAAARRVRRGAMALVLLALAVAAVIWASRQGRPEPTADPGLAGTPARS